MPALRCLTLPATCGERAVDAEAVYGLTELTMLFFSVEPSRREYEDGGVYVVTAQGEWVLDLSRLTTLTILEVEGCPVTDKQVRALSSLTGLTHLNLACCRNITSNGLRAVSSLAALTHLELWGCSTVTDAGVRTLSSLAALTHLNLCGCEKVTAATKRALRTALPNLELHPVFG